MYQVSPLVNIFPSRDEDVCLVDNAEAARLPDFCGKIDVFGDLVEDGTTWFAVDKTKPLV